MTDGIIHYSRYYAGLQQQNTKKINQQNTLWTLRDYQFYCELHVLKSHCYP